MATIPLTDKLGLELNAEPAETSALLKYVQQLPKLHLDSLDLSKIGGLTLDQPALTSLTTGVSFQDPITLSAGGPALTVAAGVSGSIGLIADVGGLPGNDDSMELAADACYLEFKIEATASADLSASSGLLTFGASPSSQLEVTSCSRFAPKVGITLLQAVQDTVSQFSITASSSDFAGLQPGQITRVSASGALTLSGTADLLATANPLAAASLPAPLPAVAVSAGGSVTVGVSCEIETEYEVVARKLDGGSVRLGWYPKSAAEVTVKVSASEGISAGFSGTDLFSRVVAAISASPQADLKELAGAGVSDDQATAIQGAVTSATCRKLEISVAAAISAKDSTAAAFLYEINPSALNDQSRLAVDQALQGNLTGLHASGLTGVSCVSSVWDNVRSTSVELDVNLLGILNYSSISSLSLEGKVLYEPATGSMAITDKATAERIQSTEVNFGADTGKLRHVLAESFLITAVYHGAKQIAAGPALHCCHSFFELRNSTSAQDMKSKLQTGFAIGLLSASEAKPPAGVSDFGRTLFTASTDYDADLVTAMFLDAGGTPLPHERFETAGRMAIQYLVQEGDDDAARRYPAIDDTLWNRMKELGQPGFPSLFPGIAAPLAAAIEADYSTIQWWADAMVATARKLSEFRSWLNQHPAAALEDPDFQQRRNDLAGYLRGVAANTREEFGQPWGLIAMNQLAGSTAGAKILISGPDLVLSKRRYLAAAVGA